VCCYLSRRSLCGAAWAIGFAVIEKEEDPFIDDQGREAVNFQIGMGIYTIMAAFLCIVLIGIPILAGLALAEVIFIVLACVRSNEGEQYRYPLTIRIL